MSKILLLCAESNTVRTFRVPLIKTLIGKGYDVGVCAFDEKEREFIEGFGVDFFCNSSTNRTTNPLKLFRLQKDYIKIIKAYKPDIVLTFILKPNTFGVLASHKAGVKNIFSMVEGAGDVFIKTGLKWKFIRKVVCHLYKKAFRYSKKVFFLNNDDKAEFVNRKLVKESQCEVIHGIGVDLEHFAEKPIKNHNTFLMIARMLETKGVYEYCKCARLVKKTHPEAVFNYLGAEGTVKLADIQEYIDDGSINYLGTTADVRPYIENALLLLLLSSYREGMPMSIMEAEAVGRGIITSDGIGCKDTVIEGYNGFICPRGDYKKMAEKVIWCLEHPEEAELLGKNARRFAEDHFDSIKITEKVIEVVEEEL